MLGRPVFSASAAAPRWRRLGVRRAREELLVGQLPPRSSPCCAPDRRRRTTDRGDVEKVLKILGKAVIFPAQTGQAPVPHALAEHRDDGPEGRRLRLTSITNSDSNYIINIQLFIFLGLTNYRLNPPELVLRSENQDDSKAVMQRRIRFGFGEGL